MNIPNHSVIRYEVEGMSDLELGIYYYSLVSKYDSHQDYLYNWFNNLSDDQLTEIRLFRHDFAGIFYFFFEIALPNGHAIIGKSIHKENSTVEYHRIQYSHLFS